MRMNEEVLSIILKTYREKKTFKNNRLFSYQLNKILNYGSQINDSNNLSQNIIYSYPLIACGGIVNDFFTIKTHYTFMAIYILFLFQIRLKMIY